MWGNTWFSRNGFPVNDCMELFWGMSQQSRSWRCCSGAASWPLFLVLTVPGSSLGLTMAIGVPGGFWPYSPNPTVAELTQMLPCSDLAQMPEACDTCLEYFTDCALCTWWEAHVRHCSGISSPFLFCTLKAILLHNKPADWHDSSTGTCFSVPRDTGRLSRRAWGLSGGAGVPLNPHVRTWARSGAVLVRAATPNDSQHFVRCRGGAVTKMASVLLCSCAVQNWGLAWVWKDFTTNSMQCWWAVGKDALTQACIVGLVLLWPCASGQDVHTPHRLAGGGGQGKCIWGLQCGGQTPLSGKMGFPWFPTWCSLLVGFVLQGVPALTGNVTCGGRESSRPPSFGVRVAELTVTGLPHLQAQWPVTSPGGKGIPASLQLRKLGEVLQALGAAAWQEKVGHSA